MTRLPALLLALALTGCASTARVARLERHVQSQGVLLNVCADAVLELQEDAQGGGVRGRLVAECATNCRYE